MNNTTMSLDYQDATKIAELLTELENKGAVKVRSITFDVYGQHRVTASRGRSTWNRLRIRKIVRIP